MKGATLDCVLSSLLDLISIHAPVKGATGKPLDRVPVSQNFNPRSREGSDRAGPLIYVAVRDFNPRSREGSDLRIEVPGYHINDFNPRSREGSDGAGTTGTRRPGYFNPRSREGSDILAKATR